MSLIYKLRNKFDEAYRIRHGFGLSPIRSKRELRALIAFCKNELDQGYESSFLDTYRETLRLYEIAQKANKLDEPHMHWADLYKYIEMHTAEYWS